MDFPLKRAFNQVMITLTDTVNQLKVNSVMEYMLVLYVLFTNISLNSKNI